MAITLATIGSSIAKGAQAAQTIKGAFGRRKEKGANVTSQRPLMGQFVEKVEDVKSRVTSQPLLPSLEIETAQSKGKTIPQKLHLLYRFIRQKRIIKKARRLLAEKRKEIDERKEKENLKENPAKSFITGSVSTVTKPIRSAWDQILNAVGTLVSAQIMLWMIKNPEGFVATLNIVKGLVDTIANIIIGTVDVVGGIVLTGYDLVDGFENWTKDTFGEKAHSTLKSIQPAILGAINALIAAGSAILAFRAFAPKPPRIKKPKTGGNRGLFGRGRGTPTASGGRSTGPFGGLREIGRGITRPFRGLTITRGDAFHRNLRGKASQPVTQGQGGTSRLFPNLRAIPKWLRTNIHRLNPFPGEPPKISGDYTAPTPSAARFGGLLSRVGSTRVPNIWNSVPQQVRSGLQSISSWGKNVAWPKIARAFRFAGPALQWAMRFLMAATVVDLIAKGRYKDAMRFIISAGLSWVIFNTVMGISGASAAIVAIASGGTLTLGSLALIAGGLTASTVISGIAYDNIDKMLQSMGLSDGEAEILFPGFNQPIKKDESDDIPSDDNEAQSLINNTESSKKIVNPENYFDNPNFSGPYDPSEIAGYAEGVPFTYLQQYLDMIRSHKWKAEEAMQSGEGDNALKRRHARATSGLLKFKKEYPKVYAQLNAIDQAYIEEAKSSFIPLPVSDGSVGGTSQSSKVVIAPISSGEVNNYGQILHADLYKS